MDHNYMVGDTLAVTWLMIPLPSVKRNPREV